MFLSNAVEIHRMCKVYGQTDVHGEGGQGRPSLVTDNLVEEVDKRNRMVRQLGIEQLSKPTPW